MVRLSDLVRGIVPARPGGRTTAQRSARAARAGAVPEASPPSAAVAASEGESAKALFGRFLSSSPYVASAVVEGVR